METLLGTVGVASLGLRFWREQALPAAEDRSMLVFSAGMCLGMIATVNGGGRAMLLGVAALSAFAVSALISIRQLWRFYRASGIKSGEP
jgi:hypothetical protein